MKRHFSCDMCEGRTCDLDVDDDNEMFLMMDPACCPFTPDEALHGLHEVSPIVR